MDSIRTVLYVLNKIYLCGNNAQKQQIMHMRPLLDLIVEGAVSKEENVLLQFDSNY